MIDDEIESLHIVSLRVSIPVGLVASRRRKFKSRPRETLWAEIPVAAGRAAAARRIAGWLQVNRRLARPGPCFEVSARERTRQAALQVDKRNSRFPGQMYGVRMLPRSFLLLRRGKDQSQRNGAPKELNCEHVLAALRDGQCSAASRSLSTSTLSLRASDEPNCRRFERAEISKAAADALADI